MEDNKIKKIYINITNMRSLKVASALAFAYNQIYKHIL